MDDYFSLPIVSAAIGNYYDMIISVIHMFSSRECSNIVEYRQCPSFLLVSCPSNTQNLSQGWFCLDICMCCHTEKEVADLSCYLRNSILTSG